MYPLDFKGDLRANPGQQGVGAEWGSWDSLEIGHRKALMLMRALRQNADRFLDELTRTRKAWETARSHSTSTCESEKSTARRTFEAEKKKCEGQRDKDISETEGRRKTAQALMDASQNFADGLPANTAASRIARQNLDVVSKCNDAVLAAINEKIRALQALCECRIANAQAVEAAAWDQANADKRARDDQADRSFDQNRNLVCDRHRQNIERGFRRQMLTAYSQSVTASRFNPEAYTIPEEFPDFVMLGQIGVTVPDSSDDEKTVVSEIEVQAGSMGRRDDQGYAVELPYAQRLADGISLLISYDPQQKFAARQMMQPLVLKMFLSFPAGKIEATMIDPVELGGSFPDVPRLAGNNSARVINQKIWSRPNDIDEAIATLSQRLENITTSYGNDRAARLKKEPIRVLAITDFPSRFSDRALDNLRPIVRNAAARGVCVLICADETEMEKLRARNSMLYEEITQNIMCTKMAADGSLRLMLAEDPNCYLRLDTMFDAAPHMDRLIADMSYAIEHMRGRVEPFDDLFVSGGRPRDVFDSNWWGTGSQNEIEVPIGICGASTVVNLVMGRGGGSTEHHALVAGSTGAGKSTFFHTLIMSTLLTYSPEQVQLYLLDFKEGVEFKRYTKYRLPALRVVAINSEREFGLAVLQELCEELTRRARLFRNVPGVVDPNISDYNNQPGVERLPRLVMIFDEVQELFRRGAGNDSITAECLECIGNLTSQGRAMGIHLILASQDFNNCAGLNAYFSQMAIRIALKGSEEGAASILANDNKGIRALQEGVAGAAIYNRDHGVESANTVFQVCYLDENEHNKLLGRMDEYYRDPAVAELYADCRTRILLTAAEDNDRNPFNQLILNGAAAIQPIGDGQDGFGMLLGQSFSGDLSFKPQIRRGAAENLAVVTPDETVALSLFEMAAMSLLFEELHTDAEKDNALIYMVDMHTKQDYGPGVSTLKYFGEQFPQQIVVDSGRDTEALLDTLYENVKHRMEDPTAQKERVFLMFFGITRAGILRRSGLYGNNDSGISAQEKLRTILREGPQHGVHCIIWGDGINGLRNMLEPDFARYFNHRIAYGLDSAAMSDLVAEEDTQTFRGKTAVYLDMSENIVMNTRFRPFDAPSEAWVERFAEVYGEIVGGGDYQ